MTAGPATGLAAIAALLATIVWWITAKRLALPDWFGMFLFGLCLVLVILAGPLVRLP